MRSPALQVGKNVGWGGGVVNISTHFPIPVNATIYPATTADVDVWVHCLQDLKYIFIAALCCEKLKPYELQHFFYNCEK
jgi:hypothetical protein